MKPIESLRPEDFDDVPVWRLASEGMVAPHPGVDEIADGARDLWVAVHGKLADETPVRGFARVECPPPAFFDPTLFVDEQRFHLSFTSDMQLVDPAAMAQQLNRPLTHVFPIWIRAEVKAECTGDTISQEIDVTGPTNAEV